ncbi:MAG: hypothetical protein M9915_12935 [Rhizobacter sp.]|nr:hypothetical protein [Rhizobacter sp.]
MKIALLDGLLSLLSRYRKVERLSPDFITGTPSFHPMAEAKYLSALATLRTQGALSSGDHTSLIPSALAVLRESNLSPVGAGFTWGLGFEWIDRPKSEPYLITSALCTQALLDNSALLDDQALQALGEYALAGLCRWVTSDRVSIGRRSIPAYSPTVRAPIFNPGAYAAGTIATARRRPYTLPKRALAYPEKMLRELERVRVRGVGWPYSTSRNASDLVHICYIFHAYLQLLDPFDAEEVFMPIVGQHYYSNLLLDRVRIIGQLPKSGLGDRGFKGSIIRRTGDTWYAVDSERARLWGVGELLVTASRLAEIGRHKMYWSMIVNGIVDGFNYDELGQDDRFVHFHRHTMHLAHGLAASLPHISEATDTSGIVKFLARCAPLT